MPRIGLIYEDESIHIAFEIIARKLLPAPIEIFALEGGSWPGIAGLTPNLLQVLSIQHLASPFDCVFVVFDSNGKPPGSRVAHVLGQIGNRTYAFGAPNFHAIVRQVETWLLGDQQSLNKTADKNLAVIRDPESLNDPKRHLIQVLANERARVRYDRKFLRDVLEAADLDEIARTCPNFREFREKLLNCPNRQLPLINA